MTAGVAYSHSIPESAGVPDWIWAVPVRQARPEPPVKEDSHTPRDTVEPTSEESDFALLCQAQAGSRESFETLVVRYRHPVARLAARFLPDAADAEDLTQDAFVRAYCHLHQVKVGVPFRNWLMRLTVNLCLDRLRYRRRRPEHLVSQIQSEDPNWAENQLGKDAAEIFQRLESSREARALLRLVIPRLSRNDQLLLHLLYGEQLEVPEVAELLGWSTVNVRVRAFRARRSLKRIIEGLLAGREGKP